MTQKRNPTVRGGFLLLGLFLVFGVLGTTLFDPDVPARLENGLAGADRLVRGEPALVQAARPPLAHVLFLPLRGFPPRYVSQVWSCAVSALYLGLTILFASLVPNHSGRPVWLLAYLGLLVTLQALNFELRAGDGHIVSLACLLIAVTRGSSIVRGASLLVALLLCPSFALLLPWLGRFAPNRGRGAIGFMITLIFLTVLYAERAGWGALLQDHRAWLGSLGPITAGSLARVGIAIALAAFARDRVRSLAALLVFLVLIAPPDRQGTFSLLLPYTLVIIDTLLTADLHRERIAFGVALGAVCLAIPLADPGVTEWFHFEPLELFHLPQAALALSLLVVALAATRPRPLLTRTELREI